MATDSHPHPSKVRRLYWITQHPAGQVVLREDLVHLDAVEHDAYVVSFADGYGRLRIARGAVVELEGVEVTLP